MYVCIYVCMYVCNIKSCNSNGSTNNNDGYNVIVKLNRPGECSPEKDCYRLWWLTFRQSERKSSTESSDLTVTTTDNSLSQDYTHPDDETPLVACYPRAQTIYRMMTMIEIMLIVNMIISHLRTLVRTTRQGKSYIIRKRRNQWEGGCLNFSTAS